MQFCDKSSVRFQPTACHRLIINNCKVRLSQCMRKKKGRDHRATFLIYLSCFPLPSDFAVYWPNDHWFQLLMEYPTVLKSLVGCYLSGMQATIQGRTDERKITLPTMNRVLFNKWNEIHETERWRTMAGLLKSYGRSYSRVSSQLSIQTNSRKADSFCFLLCYIFLSFKPALIAHTSHQIFTAGAQPPWGDWNQLHEQKEQDSNS